MSFCLLVIMHSAEFNVICTDNIGVTVSYRYNLGQKSLGHATRTFLFTQKFTYSTKTPPPNQC